MNSIELYSIDDINLCLLILGRLWWYWWIGILAHGDYRLKLAICFSRIKSNCDTDRDSDTRKMAATFESSSNLFECWPMGYVNRKDLLYPKQITFRSDEPRFTGLKRISWPDYVHSGMPAILLLDIQSTFDIPFHPNSLHSSASPNMSNGIDFDECYTFSFSISDIWFLGGWEGIFHPKVIDTTRTHQSDTFQSFFKPHRHFSLLLKNRVKLISLFGKSPLWIECQQWN